MKLFRYKHLAHALRQPILITWILTFILIFAISQHFMAKNHRQAMERLLKDKQHDIELTLTQLTETALMAATNISGREFVQDAYNTFYRTDDLEAGAQIIQKHIDPIITELQSINGRKPNVHFHLPPARSFIRCWSDDRGDDLTGFRNTILDISRNHKPLQGIEVGRSGPVIRGLAPIFSESNGTYLGSVEVFYPGDEFINAIDTDHKENITFFLNNDQLNIADKLREYFGSNINAGTLKLHDMNLLYSTSDNVDIEHLREIIQQDNLQSAHIFVDPHHAHITFPLYDYSHQNIGLVIYEVDIMEYRAILHRQFTLSLAILLIISILMFVALTLFTHQLITKPLQSVSQLMGRVAKGRFTDQLTVDRVDEIGKMQRALNNMVTSLNEKNLENERKIRYLNNIPTPVHVIDTDYNVLFVNSAAAEFVHKRPEQCLGKKCYELFNTDHCRSKHCCPSKAMRTGKVYTSDTSCTPADTAIPIRYTGAPLTDETGTMIGSIEYILDVSDEATIIDMAQHISEGHYDIAIPLRSEDDQLTRVLNSMTTSLKQMNAETQAQNWLKTGQNKLNETLRGEHDIVALSRKVIAFLASYLDASVGALYLYQNRDELYRLMGTYAYTHRKHLNTEVKPGESLVGQAILERQVISLNNLPQDYIRISSGLGDSAPQCIIVVPCETDNYVLAVIELASLQEFTPLQREFLEIISEPVAIAFKTALANERLKQLLDTTQQQAEELQAQQEELRVANEELEQQTEELQATSEKLRQQQEELQAANEELEEKTEYLERQSDEINRKNTDLEVAKKEVERKAKDLAAASKYKSEFLANMSHELRTPLNSLLILARDLANNKKGNLSDTQVEAASIIYNSGNDLLNLINEILDLSKIEAGKMSINLHPLLLSDIKKNLMTNFTPLIKQKNVAFAVNIDPDIPQEIKSDQQRIEQILKNLISNAIKFTHQGSITVHFHSPTISVDHPCIAISVTDTGIGIPQDKLAAIFEAFQQADGSTSRKYGGTGLGLSISTQLAQLLGGKITVESTPGTGSTFTAYLAVDASDGSPTPTQAVAASRPVEQPVMPPPKPTPAREKKEINAEAPHIPDDRDGIEKGDKTILVIEDDLNFARTLQRFAAEHEFKFIHAGSGEDGLCLAKSHLPDAIILDIKLPGISGWDVLDALKENADLRHIPVHMMSVEEKTIDAFRKGAIGFLNKPTTREDIETAFGQLVSLNQRDMKKLLVIEDDPMVQESIVSLLEETNLEIDTADLGQDALQMLQQNTYDCVILDLSLPDMTGMQLLNTLQKSSDEQLPPIIIHTGQELTQEEEFELQKYAKSIIIKGAKSEERLLDETTLFLHQVIADLPDHKQKMISRLHDKDALFENRRILVVDDDMRNVFAVSHVLEEKGMMVHKAANGQKALEMLEDTPDMDLVLMDIMMPVMDGFETMKAIRNNPKTQHLKIIALTAKAMKDDRDKCIKAGANDYLSKPLDIDKLLSLMRVWLYR
jgi:CheY-like chemotaxis protein/PAS domain-containing protein